MESGFLGICRHLWGSRTVQDTGTFWSVEYSSIWYRNYYLLLTLTFKVISIYIYYFLVVMEYGKAGCETPGPPGVSAGGSVGTPSPSRVGVAGLAGLSEGSLSPLPLLCKCCKPISTETSPSGLPPAPKMRAVISQSVEPIDMALVGAVGFASSEEELSLPSEGEDMDPGNGAELFVGEEEEEWESESNTTSDSDMTARGCVGDQVAAGSDAGHRTGGIGNSNSSVGGDQALEIDPTVTTGRDRASRSQGATNSSATLSDWVDNHRQLGGGFSTSQHHTKATSGLRIPRLPRHLLTVPERSIPGDTPASRRTYVSQVLQSVWGNHCCSTCAEGAY